MAQNGLSILKSWLTILVIFHHTAITYGAQGGWYYREILPNASLSSKLLVYFCTINQAYFMGFFFLLAGYFTLPSLQAKGTWVYMKDRLKRFGLPLLFYGYGLGLVTISIAQTSKNKNFGDSLWYLYQKITFETGPLWFLKALLVFAAVTILVNKLVSIKALQSFPSQQSLVIWAIGIGFVTYFVRLYYPVGKEFWSFQLGYFPLYILLFATGLLASQNKLLENIPQDLAKTWRRIALYTLPLIIPLGFFSLGNAAGGWNMAALVYAMWEPFVAFGAILWLLFYVGKHKENFSKSQNLSPFAFGVYIIHPLVVVGIAIFISDVQIHALLKFLITGTFATIICFILIWLYQRLVNWVFSRGSQEQAQD